MESDIQFVAVLNKKLPAGKVMNALGHMTLGLSVINHKYDMEIIDYMDKDGFSHWASKYGFIVLKARNSNQIFQLSLKLAELELPYTTFVHTMTQGTWQEQVELTKSTPTEQLEYYGLLTIGPKDVLKPLTKRFSLWI